LKNNFKTKTNRESKEKKIDTKI